MLLLAVCWILLGYVVKVCLHTHRGAHKEKKAGWGAQLMPCPGCSQDIPGAISPSKAHLHKPRGAQRHKGKQEPKLRTERKGHAALAPPRAVRREPQPQCQGIKVSECLN